MKAPFPLLSPALALALGAAAPAAACEAVLGMHHPASPRVIAPVRESQTTCGGSGVCVLATLGYSNAAPRLDASGNPETFASALLSGNGACTAAPGDFSCLFQGTGLYTAQIEAEVLFSLGSRCKAVIAKEFFIDSAPPGLRFEPDPSGRILSSTDTFDIVASDDAGVAAIEADSVFVWGSPIRGEGGPDNVFNYPVYDPARKKVSVPYPLSAKRGAQNLHARVLDHPLNEFSKDAQFSVDAELPKVSISTPLLASPDGVLLPIRGTASDDLGLAKVEVALQTGAGGALDWRDAGAVSGTEADWSYGGFTETIPLTGALWTVRVRVTDVYGRTAEASTKALIVPARNLREVLGHEAPGQACPKRLDRQAPFSSFDVNPIYGGAAIASNQLSEPPKSPALNIATAFHSKSPKDSVWGWGWSSMHDQTLFLRPSGAVRWTGGDLSKKNFFPPPSGDAYVSPIQEFSRLTVTERGFSGT
ncbi:MAG: hypothetical protein HY928_03375, partial [Elusimicrobia bacterium]|nr:hypothetical protein [Elusimicrobiota bacterium]